MSLWLVGVVAVVFGCAAYMAIEASALVCKNIVPFDDGPQPGRPPSAILIAGAAAIGASLALRGAEFPSLAIAALLVVSLVACWHSDVLTGIVPDVFTLAPLGLLFVYAFATQNWSVFLATLGVVIPFGIAAVFTRGRGMGWGDVKLVALGGAAMGLTPALLTFAAACLTAVVVASLRRRRREPIAFAPYLAGAIGVALIFNIF